jgi:ribosome-binding factor A
MNRRLQRLNGLFREELADLIRDIRDPRLASIVSITRVDVSPDLEKAVVHASVLGTNDEKHNSIAALSRAAPFLRRELLSRIRIRRVPTLEFHLDQTIEEAAHVLDLMKQVIPAQPVPAPKQADD